MMGMGRAKALGFGASYWVSYNFLLNANYLAPACRANEHLSLMFEKCTA
jgi:hypothetical protein